MVNPIVKTFIKELLFLLISLGGSIAQPYGWRCLSSQNFHKVNHGFLAWDIGLPKMINIVIIIESENSKDQAIKQ